ncbi:MAG: FIST N-terminal domain-containing protein [Hyphomicrobium sp.]
MATFLATIEAMTGARYTGRCGHADEDKRRQVPTSRKATVAQCGIRVAASSLASTRESVKAVREELGNERYQHIIAFFSIEHDPNVLIAALEEFFPEIAVSGCSTAGEFGPLGMMQGGLVLIAFPERGFRVLSEVIPDASQPGIERATQIARRLKVQISDGHNGSIMGHVFAMMLTDGLANKEEALTAAVHWGLDDIELIGGSAGDGLAFQRTTLVHKGRVVSASALLFLIESAYPFRVFKTQNFEPTPIKLVVTAANTENRIVYELNAEPAAREYAAAIGLQPDELGPFSFASYPLVVKIGGDYYCRSIRNMNPDGSLSFFCAIDEGLVFTVARPRDMVRSTLETLDKVDSELGGTDLIIGFDCILRRLDAESHQVRHSVDEIYRRFGVAGFHTYGEQYNAMHLNQTLTGIAFGKSCDGI